MRHNHLFISHKKNSLVAVFLFNILISENVRSFIALVVAVIAIIVLFHIAYRDVYEYFTWWPFSMITKSPRDNDDDVLSPDDSNLI